MSESQAVIMMPLRGNQRKEKQQTHKQTKTLSKYCKELRKGNVFLICICSGPLQCTVPSIFLFLGLPECTGHAGFTTGKASALRLVFVTAAFFLCCRKRGKSATCELLLQEARGYLRCFSKEHLL